MFRDSVATQLARIENRDRHNFHHLAGSRTSLVVYYLSVLTDHG
jgi:hypothetical protein